MPTNFTQLLCEPKPESFYEWKKNLKEISGNNINSWKFNKQLLLLHSLFFKEV